MVCVVTLDWVVCVQTLVGVIMYGLLTKLVRSRWLDIAELILRVYGP